MKVFVYTKDQRSEKITTIENVMRVSEVEISELNYEGDTTPCIVQDSPTFTGIYKSEEEEPLEYRFSLYYSTNEYNLISTTGWKKHISGQNYHYGRFPVLLENHHNYNIIYEVKTVNNFQPTLSVARAFRTDFFHIQDDIGLSITSGKDYDNGGVHGNSGVPNYAAYLMYNNGAFSSKEEMAMELKELLNEAKDEATRKAISEAIAKLEK